VAKKKLYQEHLRAGFKAADRRRAKSVQESIQTIQGESKASREERYNRMRAGVHVPQDPQLVNPPRPASLPPVQARSPSRGRSQARAASQARVASQVRVSSQGAQSRAGSKGAQSRASSKGSTAGSSKGTAAPRTPTWLRNRNDSPAPTIFVRPVGGASSSTR
jgi:hypothetical protein